MTEQTNKAGVLMESQIRVFRINDDEWWAGAGTPEEILAQLAAVHPELLRPSCYERLYGVTEQPNPHYE
jgi:hypothetical protein